MSPFPYQRLLATLFPWCGDVRTGAGAECLLGRQAADGSIFLQGVDLPESEKVWCGCVSVCSHMHIYAHTVGMWRDSSCTCTVSEVGTGSGELRNRKRSF